MDGKNVLSELTKPTRARFLVVGSLFSRFRPAALFVTAPDGQQDITEENRQASDPALPPLIGKEMATTSASSNVRSPKPFEQWLLSLLISEHEQNCLPSEGMTVYV